MSKVAEYEQKLRLPETAADAVARQLSERLPEIRGISVVSGPAEPPRRMMEPLSYGMRPSEPTVAELLTSADKLGADTVLITHLHPLRQHSGIESELAVRLTCWVASRREPALRGPFHSVGWARTLRAFKATAKTDDQLAAGAAQKAASMLLASLETGAAFPLASPLKVGVIGASVQTVLQKRFEGRMEAASVILPSLQRQRDVLLQPDMGPFIDMLEADDFEKLLQRDGLDERSMWRNGLPDSENIRRAARVGGVDFVFISRVIETDLSDLLGADAKVMIRRAVLSSEACLLNGATGAVVWRAVGQGSATSRREEIRGRVRLATEDQVVIDAARMAYASLRVQYDVWRQGFEKQRRSVFRP